MVVGSIVLGGLALLFGSATAYYGYRRWRLARRLTSTPTTALGDLTPGEVKIEGTVQAADADPSPIGQDDRTVLAAWQVEQWHEYDDEGKPSRWETEGTGITATPFTVADDTGQVTVDPEGDGEMLVDGGGLRAGGNLAAGVVHSYVGLGGLLPEASNGVTVENVVTEFEGFEVVREVGAEETAPDHIQDFQAIQPTIDPAIAPMGATGSGNGHGDRRYYEATIQDGDQVTVLGQVRASETDGPLLQPVDGEPFVVSTVGASSFRSLAWRGLVVAAGGVGIVLVGLALAVLVAL